MRSFFNRLAKDQRGATSVEYAFILVFIVAASMAIITTLGTTVQDMYDFTNTTISEATADAIDG